MTTQARWALAAVTGRTTWPHTLKMRKETRRRLCDDMGWQDLWDLAQIEAIMLLNRCMNDSQHLAHSKLANDPAGSAPGGWIRGTHALMNRLGIHRNRVPVEASAKERLALNKSYRKKVVRPAVEKREATGATIALDMAVGAYRQRILPRRIPIVVATAHSGKGPWTC